MTTALRGEAPISAERSFHSLSAVTDRIAHYLGPALGKTFWVRAEISSGRERGGNYYCDLLETDSRGRVVAKLACTIWSRRLSDIRARFREEGLELSIENGSVVGVECSLQYSAKYGLSLEVEDADPAFSLGEMERRKREILVRLQAEGLGAVNKKLGVPLLPRRIGLITSKGSAAYSDFVKTLTDAGEFGFSIYLADANMQGTQTEPGVLRALRLFDERQVDLVVLVRGGGSKTDLYSLDSEVLARAIAGLSRPVWTGIGHEIDNSVLDYVANQAFVTPTAVAEELVAHYLVVKHKLNAARNRLPLAWSQRMNGERDYVRRMAIGLRQGSRKLLQGTRIRGRLQSEQLRGKVGIRLNVEGQSLAIAKHKLERAPLEVLRSRRENLGRDRRQLEGASRRRLSIALALFAQLTGRWDPSRFGRPISRSRDDLERKRTELSRFIERRLIAERSELEVRRRTLVALDPSNTLRRGYSLVYDAEGVLVKSVAGVQAGDTLSIQSRDGRILTRVEQTERSNDEGQSNPDI
jgi:exodeoxyribonuclease VII large subunit